MQQATYCLRWNSVLRAPVEVLSPLQAEIRHEERKPYVVVLGNDERAVVEMTFFQAYCHLQLLDALGRVVSRYAFIEAGGRLFLEQVTLHFYADSGDRPSAGEVFRFGRNGSLTHDSGKAGGQVVRREGQLDVTDNYLAIPGFGDYEPLLAKARAGS
jgi:hypothetical protein